MKKKKLSKTAQMLKARAINKKLVEKFTELELEKDRKVADKEDVIDVAPLDVNKFNAEAFKQAMQDSGIGNSSNPFADMERLVQNSEAIRELVDIKNIKLKTNVTEEQHHIIVVLASGYNNLLLHGVNFRALKELLGEFIELAPSIQGVRAEQYVTAHQAVADAVARANAGHNPNAIVNEGKQ